jgi:UPF0271 protein
VKPHGALFSIVGSSEEHACAVAEAIAAIDPSLILLQSGVVAAEAAHEAGITFVQEAYVDLDYAADGTLLVERTKAPRDPADVGARARQLVTDATVPTIDGGTIPLTAKSICIHGDGPNAPQLAAAVRAALRESRVTVTSLRRLAPGAPETDPGGRS